MRNAANPPAVVEALLKVVAGGGHGVGDVGETNHPATAGGGVGIQSGSLHLHAYCSGTCRGLDRRRGFPVGGVGRPGRPGQHGAGQVVESTSQTGVQTGTEVAPPARRQVMGAGALIAQGPLEKHEARNGRKGCDLAGGGDAHDHLSTGCGQLLSDQHRKRCSHRHADHPDLDAVEVSHPHLGVVAGPPRMAPTPPGGEMTDDVTIGVEQGHPGHRRNG